MISVLQQRWLGGLAMASAIAVVAACGGSGVVGSGGTGQQPGVSSGTVTGFGSIIVDGIRFDDANAPATVERVPGQPERADPKLGQRVEVDAAADGVASAVRIEAELVGPVEALVGGGFTLLGQQVAANADATAGPVTQFAGGYTRLADVLPGDTVEVHGVRAGSGSAAVVRATRIEKLAGTAAYLRVAGPVAALNGSRFTIGSLTIDAATARIVPSGARLADGRTVVVLGPPSGLAAGVFTAAQVRVRERSASGVTAYLGGAIVGLDAAARIFTVDGVTVRYGPATLDPASLVLAEGQYVRVRGSIAADGVFDASLVKRRDGQGEPESELKGSILGLNAAALSFTVRDVAVDASSAVFESCPTPLVEGLFVEIEGSLTATGVRARKVHCEDAPPAGSTIGRSGRASAVDTGARSFTLTTEVGTVLTVTWSDSTFFGSVTPATLSGKKVEVQGVLSGTTLAASKIALDD